MTAKSFIQVLWLPLLATLFCATAIAHADTQFFDDFDALNPSVWFYPTGDASFNGRTQMRPSYPIADGVLHLRVDTYSPDAEGVSFLGSEIITKQDFLLGTGLSVEFKARLVTPVLGLVGGAFLYKYFPTGMHSEIDFEFITNFQDKVQTNIYANESLGAGSFQFNSLTGLDMARYNTYRIEWLPERVRWFVNNALVRETKVHVPKESMALHLNFYVPDCYWTVACDSQLKPAETPEDNKTYYFDIDWVRVVTGLKPEK